MVAFLGCFMWDITLCSQKLKWSFQSKSYMVLKVKSESSLHNTGLIERTNFFLNIVCLFLAMHFKRSKPHFSFTTGSEEWENASQPNSVVFKPLKVFYIARTYWYIFNKSKQLFIISTYLQINNYADKDRLLKCTTKYDEKVERCLDPDIAGTCSILIWTAK